VNAPVPAPLGVVSHYNLLERLEPSGPGELFRARDTHRGRTVTIRLLPPDYVRDEPAREALIDQARSLIPLSHPNITTLFDAGQQDARVFLAFEHVKGQSLRAEMSGRPMNARRTLELAIQITDAVAEAHAAGFVHGGLSPQSVMVTVRGHAKIPTFHLASQVGFDPAYGESNLHDYDSPEEARGEAADDRSDIYSIGAVMYEMLTTRRPSHKGASAPSAANQRVPLELDGVVLKAIHPRPQHRYQSAASLAADLRTLAATLDARDVSGDEDDQRPAAARSKAVPIVIGGLVVAAAAAVAWWLTRS
jgi:eukaryotic-like serine/threonine-protein kinase